MWRAITEPASPDPLEVDLLVIGGGITGAGVARDAARRGLRVVLVEMQDLASGTSSRSSKLVHGGLRYLQQYEFGLVFESVSERRVLSRIAPHLVHPLGFLFPVYERDELQLWKVNAGMWLYDVLALFRSHKLHRTLRRGRLAEVEPTLSQDELVGAPLYWDASTDDARLTLETALDAVAHGASVVPWCRAAAYRRDADGRLDSVEVVDELTGERRRIRAARVANCTGPWTDATLSLEGTGLSPDAPRLLRRTKGVHAVVRRTALPVEHAIVMVHPRDRRVLFAIPWGDRTYLGTTDTDYEGDPNDVAAELPDIDYLLEATAAYFPGHPLGYDDVVATWAGVRPLVAPPAPGADAPGAGVDESQVSREHTIREGDDGVITVAGGKLTTYRKMAQEIVDLVVRGLLAEGKVDRGALARPPTDRVPLPGADGWPEAEPGEDDDPLARIARRAVEAGRGQVSPELARHLAATYGTRAPDLADRCAREPELARPLCPGRPEVLAQVDHAVDAELATRLVDVLIRRTQLFFRDPDQGLGAVDQIARRMAGRLGWDDTRREDEVARYQQEVARARRWRRALAELAAGSAAS
jgi:glycerol-3-phosphate dehydrogenase